jgi:hypothetical protein
MNHLPDNERLLEDVLAEGADSGFRAALLDETLHMARRRRLSRNAWKAATTFALVALCCVLAQHYFPKYQFRERQISRTYVLVVTRSSPDVAIVGTLPLGTDRLASSAPHLVVFVTSTREWRAIYDEELLALVAPRPAVLFRHGANSEELVFVNPADQGEIHLN